MIERERRLERIVGVLHEYFAARIAVGLLDDQLGADPMFLERSGLRGRVALDLRINLETTYLIRLFAEFEAGLRDAWRKAFHQNTEPPMQDLLDAVAARRHISGDWLARAHRVRVYRNSLVHQGQTAAEPVGLLEARDHLCRFFSKLPGRW